MDQVGELDLLSRPSDGYGGPHPPLQGSPVLQWQRQSWAQRKDAPHFAPPHTAAACETASSVGISYCGQFSSTITTYHG